MWLLMKLTTGEGMRVNIIQGIPKVYRIQSIVMKYNQELQIVER